MQAIFPRRFKVAIATALVVVVVALATPHVVWVIALSVCASAIDLTENLPEIPCRIAKSIRTLPERMNPICPECNEP